MTTKVKPDTCDICGDPITDKFIDGATTMGPWADMDKKCFDRYGVGIGTGQGQLYELDTTDGKYHKVAG